MKTDKQLREAALRKLVDHVHGSRSYPNVTWSESDRWVSLVTDQPLGLDFISGMQKHLESEEVHLSSPSTGDIEVCFEGVKTFPWER